MNSMDLKAQLAHETQVKNQSVELARTALMNTAASFQQQLNESAQNYRSDLRDEMKRARESWEEAAKAERQRMEELTSAERRRWEESSVRATMELERTKRRLWLWGPLALLTTMLITVGLTIWATTSSVRQATGLALSELQQVEASKVAELRVQVEASRADLAKSQKSLMQIQAQISAEQQRLDAAKQLQTLLRTYNGKQPGTVFVEIEPGAQPRPHQGVTVIQAKTNP